MATGTAFSLNLGKFNRIPVVNTATGTWSPEAAREWANVQRILGGAAGVIFADTIGFVPAGDVASVNVQDAIQEIDAEKQPRDATLTALAGLATAADRLAYWSGPDTASLAVFTPFARTLLDDVDAAAMRATIGAGTGTGDVVGPAAATANALVQFNGATGKLVKDSATTLDTDTTLAANSDTRVATQKAAKTYADRPRYARQFMLMGA